MDDARGDLLLAGYLPLREYGLAVPCYVSRPGANRWHLAMCAIDGDHTALVAGFEPYEGTGVRHLPDHAFRVVGIGHPWHDVLIWNGTPRVGTPDIIMEQLGDQTAELAVAAPLTLLDLAMAINAPDRVEIQAGAFRHLEHRLGREAAERWQSDGFVRQQLMLEARRLLAPLIDAGSARAIRQLEVSRAGGRLIAIVPIELMTTLERREASAAFGERARAIAEIAGIGIEVTVEDEADALAIASEQVPTAPRQKPEISASTSRVLIILSGPRARIVGRYLDAPKWAADWNVDPDYDSDPVDWGRTYDLDAKLPGIPDIQVVDEKTALPFLDDFATVIWVADDEIISRDWGRSVPAELQAAIDAGSKALCILAPTLPPRQPSQILADKPSDRENFSIFTLLDTSTVRSPFWSGNQKRSIDRRVADLILSAAVLTVPDSPLRAYLTDDRPRYEPLLLSLSTETPRGRGSSSTLASEVSAAGLKAGRKSGPNEQFSWTVRPATRTFQAFRASGRGRAEVGRHRPTFRPFASAVVERTKLLSDLRPDERLIGQLPSTITEALRYPDLSAAFTVKKKRRERSCILMAEAPDLKALRAAADSDWHLCRYSDEESLKDLVSDGGSDRWLLPRDIQLPQLNRLGRNKGLAVRGVDPRDVIRMPAKLFEEWRRLAHGSRLTRDIRWYRSDLNPHREPPETADIAALMVSSFREAEERNDEAADLLRRLDAKLVPPAEALARRSADLRASWDGPVRDASRYMLEDGRLPIRFGPVDRKEIAAQKYFTIDGDGCVPALLLSRIFRIWAGAMLSRSPSWSSRFSITRTFETFPIPGAFTVFRDGDAGRASIRLSRSSGAIRELVRSLEHELERTPLQFAAQQSARPASTEIADTMREIDEILLREIGLERDASELAILEKLVQMNRSA